MNTLEIASCKKQHADDFEKKWREVYSLSNYIPNPIEKGNFQWRHPFFYKAYLCPKCGGSLSRERYSITDIDGTEYMTLFSCLDCDYIYARRRWYCSM